MLLENLDPDFLWRVFETFGANWWMQRQAYTFRLRQEYDCKLPVHAIMKADKTGHHGKILRPDMARMSSN